jgi:subtilase family serine protease
MHKRRILAATAAATALLGTAIAVSTPASAAITAKKVPSTKPTWLAHAHNLGAAQSGAKVQARVYLAPRGGLAALARTATAMSTPGTASYRHFLTAAQYKAQYAPTAAGVSSVEKFLRDSGLKVGSVGADNRYVTFSGTVRAAEKAFGTSLHRYTHNGQTVQAPSAALSVPASLASTVLTVDGLDTTRTAAKIAAAPPAGFRNARPCSIYFGQIQAKNQADNTTPLPAFNGQTLPYAPCGYTGPQLRAAYEGAAGNKLDGSGVTVAITDAYAAPTIAKDAEKYAETNGDGAYAPGQLTQTVASSFNEQAACQGASGWYGEETLDVEAVHAMAPGANIHYYGAQNCEDGLLDALAQAVVDDDAQLITNSWGDPAEAETADTIQAYEAVFLQGAMQGQSFMFSSGDNGDELANTGIKQADYPTSDPYVTSVGGTSTEINANAKLAKQTGWGTVSYSLSANGKKWNNPAFLYGSGGGASSLFNKPAYQAGISSSPYREVPDVAMDADPNTGMLVGETQTFPDGKYYDQYRIGGTSLASPLFAGLTALTLQNAGGGLGLLNPTIYANKTAFTDVKKTPNQLGVVRPDFINSVDASGGIKYSVRTFDQDSSLVTKAGYDEVTGLGSGSPAWATAVAPAS